MIIALILSLLAGILYRLGGSDIANTKVRDFGVPLVMLGVMYALGLITTWKTALSLVLSAVLLFASLTTYFKKKGADAHWWNWFLVGLATSASIFPYAIVTGQWIEYISRVVIVTILVTAWSQKVSNVVFEEVGRGFIIIVTLIIFKILPVFLGPI